MSLEVLLKTLEERLQRLEELSRRAEEQRSVTVQGLFGATVVECNEEGERVERGYPYFVGYLYVREPVGIDELELWFYEVWSAESVNNEEVGPLDVDAKALELGAQYNEGTVQRVKWLAFLGGSGAWASLYCLLYRCRGGLFSVALVVEKPACLPFDLDSLDRGNLRGILESKGASTRLFIVNVKERRGLYASAEMKEFLRLSRAAEKARGDALEAVKLLPARPPRDRVAEFRVLFNKFRDHFGFATKYPDRLVKVVWLER